MLELDAELNWQKRLTYHITIYVLNSKEYKSYSNRIIIYECKKKVKLYCEICEKMNIGKIYMHIFVCILFKQRKCEFFQYDRFVYAVDTKW